MTFFAIVLGYLWIFTSWVHGQVILIGCTSNVDATSPNSSIVDIDLLTGAASNPRNTGVFLIGGIATQSLTGHLFGLTTYVSSPANSLIRINPEFGSVTLVGNTGLPLVVEGDLSFNPIDGLLYGVQDGGATITQRNFFRLDPTTGAATVIANLNTQGDLSALAFANNGTLYMIDSGVIGNSLLQTIDVLSGTILNTVTMNVDLSSTVGMAFNPITGLGFVTDGGDASSSGLLYSLNVQTGFLSSIGPMGIPGGISGLSFIAVPEPSSIIFCCSGVLAFRFRTIGRLLNRSKTAMTRFAR